MSFAKISAALFAGALSFTLGGTHADAASLATRAFLDNAVPNVDFLDRSSRLALSNTKSAKVHDFARAEATEATNTANAIYEWSLANDGSVAVAGVDEAPLQTGRSAAIDATAASDARLPRGQEDIDALFGAEGKDFDSAYKQAQLDALTQVQADYQDYIARGDDAALKALATRELPKVTKRLALLNKI